MNKRVMTIAVASITLIFILGTILPVYAEGLQDLEKKLNRVNKEMNETQKELKAVQNQKKGVINEIEKIEQEIDKTENELDEINKLLSQSEKKIKEKEEELAEAMRAAEQQFEVLKLRARTMYEDGNTTYLEVLLNATSFSDFISRLEIVKEIIQYDNNLLAQLKQNRDNVAKARQAAEDERKNREKIKNRVADTKRVLNEKQVSRSQTLARLSSQEKEYERALDELEELSKQVEKEIRKLQEQNKRKYAGGKLEWPAPNYYNITSPFGNRYHPILRTTRMHTGIDIGAPSGATVKAANAGKVILAASNGGYGKCIIIDHGGGIATLYAHNSSLLVSAGDEVKKGQTIAKVGSTGWSTGPHLHFEVRENGTPVDPMKYYN
ncbi:MAG: hypothetical protein PWR27_1176 [Petroclostridium sp.]|jgi:murein DD-endopeptidase MepM/ murein hydrolase activator NlpD|uniref:murein hydrolase activator EnvC family protein n=1 Tax=Petroclostridium xylanilyticum TaxID=1792311 RepID=UPI000B994C39|nr:peptidoglycan DD-metalloendopeptidase family protein [Petroclostridium xylanilyticum]MBZ4645746.1 NlpD4 [Clostridia bacterium]MDK2810467.1 hypothetical protein [Petroclostridium sp.]